MQPTIEKAVMASSKVSPRIRRPAVRVSPISATPIHPRPILRPHSKCGTRHETSSPVVRARRGGVGLLPSPWREREAWPMRVTAMYDAARDDGQPVSGDPARPGSTGIQFPEVPATLHLKYPCAGPEFRSASDSVAIAFARSRVRHGEPGWAWQRSTPRRPGWCWSRHAGQRPHTTARFSVRGGHRPRRCVSSRDDCGATGTRGAGERPAYEGETTATTLDKLR